MIIFLSKLRDLWTNASDWVRSFDTWMNDSLSSIDPEGLERQVGECFRVFHKSLKACFKFKIILTYSLICFEIQFFRQI